MRFLRGGGLRDQLARGTPESATIARVLTLLLLLILLTIWF